MSNHTNFTAQPADSMPAATDSPATEAPAPESPTADTPTADAPTADTPTADTPAANRLEAMIRAVEKIQALAELSTTAKAVLIRLTLRYPGRAVRGDCPSPAELSPWLGLSERSIRRAYAELEGAGYIGCPTGPDGELEMPMAAAALRDGWACLEDDQPMDLHEHVANLGWLRDLAVARGRIGVAVVAEKSAGRALGFYGPARGRNRPRPEVANSGRTAREPVLEAEWPEPAETGAEPAPAGAELARTGSNWHELAETGMVHRTPESSGMFNKYRALMGGLPG